MGDIYKTLRSAAILVLMMSVRKETANAQGVIRENRGQPEFAGSALDISAAGPVVIATGLVGGETTSRWFVRGLDRTTGETQWEDRFGPATFGVAKDGETEDHRAFAAGWVFTPGRGFEFVVRAYDLQVGTLLWSQALSRGSQCVEEQPAFARCVAKALAVRDGRVFVVGHLTRTSARSDFAVLAFDGATGAPLWESVTDPTGLGLNDYAWGVAADGGRVHVVGEIGDNSDLLVQSHDEATGAIQWQQRMPDARNFTAKDTIAAGGNAVFIGGTDGRFRPFVRAYDAGTGALMWEDRFEGVGQLSALKATGSRLFAIGVDGCDPATFVACELAVRAYDAQGGLVWQRADVAAGGDWYAAILDAGAGQVIVGGNELLADGEYHPIVRSYEWNNGNFEWGAYFDDATGHPLFGFTGYMNAIVIRSDGVFVGGAVNQADGSPDWLIRKYRRR